MEIERALSQISEIHQHLTRGEVCRDWRAGPIAASGLVALAAAALQTRLVGPHPAPDATPVGYIAYWTAVAAVAALVGGGGVLVQYLREPSPYARRRTRIVTGQLSPCLAAGAIVTAALPAWDPRALALLPGLWAICFGLGVFASRPYLPRMIGYVALYYVAASGVLLTLARSGASLTPWAMGLTFGLGQLASGFVLYWNLERNGHGKQRT
jgi:hypothetical protein